MQEFLIQNAKIINEGQILDADICLKNERIEKIFFKKNLENLKKNFSKDIKIINASGKYLLPGIIDDQVHFRDFDLSAKATIESEAKAAVAGGVTSFMEMPNTSPPTISIKKLDEKFQLASKKSLANFSFYLGATNDNLSEILKVNPKKVCGIKVFMGSSTGNMLVDDEKILSEIFLKSPILIATHCEDEKTIQENTEFYKNKFGENLNIKYHSKLRSEKACFLSSSYAVNLAKKHGTRLHVLHISTEKELELFSNDLHSKDKKITAEVCVHHLWFDDRDYEKKGTKIKWNPAIKTEKDKNALLKAVLNNKIDVIATDHAPHLEKEKQNTYFNCPSGAPFVQHSLIVLLEMFHQNKISLEKIVEKLCHTPADIFQVKERGYIRENYFADLVLVDLEKPWTVNKDNILYKCAWSPIENETFKSQLTHTFVNGNLVFENGKIIDNIKGKALEFDR